MIEPNIIFLILFIGLIIAALPVVDQINCFVTRFRTRGVQLVDDEQADKRFRPSTLVPGALVAVIGLGLEALLFVFGRFGNSHPYDWMSVHFSWWVTQLTFIGIFIVVLIHAVIYPRLGFAGRPNDPGTFLQVVGLILLVLPLIVGLEADSWYNELYWYRQIMGTRPGESPLASGMVALSWMQPVLGASLLVWGTIVHQLWGNKDGSERGALPQDI